MNKEHKEFNVKNRLSTITALLGVIAFLLFIIVVQNLASTIDIQVRHHNEKMDHDFMMGDRSDPDRPTSPSPDLTGRICLVSMGDVQLMYSEDMMNSIDPSIYPDNCVEMDAFADDNTVTNIDPNIEPMPLVDPRDSGLDSASAGSAAGSVAGSEPYNPRPGMRLRM